MDARIETAPAPAPAVPRRRFFGRLLAAAAGASVLFRPRPAEAVTGEPFVGEIRLFAGNFAPQGWARCDGQILSIGSNTALFSLIGPRYGGNGVSTFALPDLRGRVPMQFGQGPGLSDHPLAESSGVESVTLATSQMPPHTHTIAALANPGSTADPVAHAFAASPEAVPMYASSPNALLHGNVLGDAGNGQAHDNMQPFLVLHYIIALQGIFPQRP